MVMPSILKLPILPHTNCNGLPLLGSPARSSDHTTSSAVIGVPSCHKTLSRKVSEILLLSAFHPHWVKIPGLKLRSGFWSM